MRLLRMVVLAIVAAMLTACGADLEGVGGSGLALRATATGIKSITFRWTDFSGATHYKLFVDPDGSSGYTQIGGDLTTNSTIVSVPVHLTRWHDARYRVEAHDGGGVIATSSSIRIDSQPLILAIIGYAKASNTGFGDNFGYRVALSGDGSTMAVSAPFEDSEATGIDGSQADGSTSDSGAVYLFVRSGETWIQQAYIKASNTDSFDYFGSSLALSSTGDTLAVGAIGEDSAAIGINNSQISDAAPSSGAVYLFRRSAGEWSQQAYIKASNTESGDAFGTSVVLSGDGNTLAVGAIGEDSAATGIGGSQISDAATDSGAVYIFTRSTDTWSQQAYIKASNTDTMDGFGGSISVSVDGNTLAVGAAGEDSIATGINNNQSSELASGSGAAYLFTRSAGAWSQVAYVKASNTDANDGFGTSVAMSGDGNTLAIGAIGEDSASTGINGSQVNGNAFSAGAVYLFTWSGSLWSQQAYIKATNTNAFDNFGMSVALSGNGDLLAVGGHEEDSSAVAIDGDQLDNIATDAGAVYMYSRTAGIWSVRNYVKAPNTDTLDNFGQTVALTGDGATLAVGAIGEDSASTGINGDMTDNIWGEAGAVYLY